MYVEIVGRFIKHFRVCCYFMVVTGTLLHAVDYLLKQHVNPPPQSVLLLSSHAAQRVLVLFRHNSLSLQLPQCRQVKDLIGKMSSPFSYHMNVSESECERARLESSNRGRCGTCCSVATQREFVFARAKVGH